MEIECPDPDLIDPLDERSQKKALEELHEDPKQRMGQIEQLRNWVKSQPHLVCRTDNRFLLRYLRGAKFSQLRARQMIEGTLGMITENKDWFKNVDPADPVVQKVIDIGEFVPLPHRDDNGCAVFMQRPGQVDPDKVDFTIDQQLKTNIVLSHYSMQSAEVQVNGSVFISDMTGVTMKHFTRMDFNKMKKFHQSFEKNIPGRFKAFHHYNHGPVFETFFALMKPFISSKFQSRMVLHGSNLESLYKKVPMRCLPVEYLPDDYDGPNAGTIKDILARVKKEVQDPTFRNWVLYDTQEKWRIDESKRIKEEEPQASFRKLNID